MKYQSLTLNLDEKILVDMILNCVLENKAIQPFDEESKQTLKHLKNKVSKNIKNCIKLNLDK